MSQTPAQHGAGRPRAALTRCLSVSSEGRLGTRNDSPAPPTAPYLKQTFRSVSETDSLAPCELSAAAPGRGNAGLAGRACGLGPTPPSLGLDLALPAEESGRDFGAGTGENFGHQVPSLSRLSLTPRACHRVSVPSLPGRGASSLKPLAVTLP